MATHFCTTNPCGVCGRVPGAAPDGATPPFVRGGIGPCSDCGHDFGEHHVRQGCVADGCSCLNGPVAAAFLPPPLRTERSASVQWGELAEWEQRLLWEEVATEAADLARRLDAVREVLDHTGYHPSKDALYAALDGSEAAR